MLDRVTLDQLRAFVTVVDEGSFSAAGRKLGRVQSAISAAMQHLEEELGVDLFDRRTKIARLTDEGAAVLSAARRVLAEVDDLGRLTTGMTQGLEAMVSLCVDALFPLSALIAVCAAFEKRFPAVDLRIDTQLMAAVGERVRSGAATLGLVSPEGVVPGLERRALGTVRMVPVVGARHPLAALRGRIPQKALEQAVQVVLTERTGDESGKEGRDIAVVASRTWRVADLHTKHMLLRAGLGWGNLPEQVVRDDLAKKRLVRIRAAMWTEDEHLLPISAIYRRDAAFGPAHTWMLEELHHLCSSL